MSFSSILRGPCISALATRVQLEKHDSVSSAAIPAVGVVSSRERREPLAQRRTRRTYIKSGRHESDAACAYPYSPRRELNRRGLDPMTIRTKWQKDPAARSIASPSWPGLSAWALK